MAKEKDLEKAVKMAASAFGRLQKALGELKGVADELRDAADIIRATKPPVGKLIMCEKCEVEMKLTKGGHYKCPQCKVERWSKEE